MTVLGLTLNLIAITAASLVAIAVLIIACLGGDSRRKRTKSRPPVRHGATFDRGRGLDSEPDSSGWFSSFLGSHGGHSDSGSHAGSDSGSSGGDSGS